MVFILKRHGVPLNRSCRKVCSADKPADLIKVIQGQATRFLPPYWLRRVNPCLDARVHKGLYEKTEPTTECSMF